MLFNRKGDNRIRDNTAGEWIRPLTINVMLNPPLLIGNNIIFASFITGWSNFSLP